MGMILNGLRGIHVLVPRNMTKAAGFYNTLMLQMNQQCYRMLEWISTKREDAKQFREIQNTIGIPEITRKEKTLLSLHMALLGVSLIKLPKSWLK